MTLDGEAEPRFDEDMTQDRASTARLGDRSLFPSLEPMAYLNHAAISPPSSPVSDAVRGVLERYGRLGVGAFSRYLEQRAGLREKLAQLVGARAADIALVPNTTRGVTDVALCFPWRHGDRLLVFEGEFPANVTPWQRAAALHGLELVMLPLPALDAVEHDGWLQRVEDELKRPGRPLRLVAVSAVQFQTGLCMPLQALASLCHAHGAELFVDAIQALGITPLDVYGWGIDYLSAGSHKWLMGLEGVATLCVHPARVGALRPHVAGWLSHEEPLRFLFEGQGHLRYDRPIRAEASFVEGGVPNTIGCAALDASVSLLLGLGVDGVLDHVDRYLDRLEAELSRRSFSSVRARDRVRRSGILSVKCPGDVDLVALHRAIDPRRLSCSTPDGYLRFSPHWPNDADRELPIVLAAIDEALDTVRAR